MTDAREIFTGALAHHRAGRSEAALAGYRAALAIDPAFVDAWSNSAILHSLAGDFGAAITALEAAEALAPTRGDIAFNRAMTLVLAGRPVEALAAIDRALALGLDQAIVHFRRAELLAPLGDARATRAAFAAALARGNQLAPAQRAAAWRGQARADLESGEFAPALAGYDASLAIEPGEATAHCLRGVALHRLGRRAEAAAALERATQLDPDYAAAWNNFGEVLRDLRDFAGARDALARAIELTAGESNSVRGQWLNARSQLADWTDFAAARAELIADFAAGRTEIVPFSLLPLVDDPALHRKCAAIWLAREPLPVVPPPPLPPPGPRLRIAYVSADFHAHATMHLLTEMLEAHDHTRFEITLVSIGPAASDAWRARAVAASDHFLDARAWSDAEIVADLRRRGIEVAVDLKGLTASGRPGIFALRAAPIQANWLGYPGTLPMPGMDYLIADHALVPEAERAHIAEALVRLPASYQPNARWTPLPPPPPRADLGLPLRAFVFASFNQIYKIMPEVWAIWMAILRGVPGSMLWLLRDTDIVEANLRAAAQAAGVAPDRLVFAATVARDAHLVRQQAADLFLDCWPCGAHTTASDALRAGLPLLARRGRSLVSRVGESLLAQVGLSDLVAADDAAYRDLAIALASDPPRLVAIRARLAAALPGSPLFDPAAMARAVEAAFAAMVARARAGAPPGDIDV